MINPAIPRNIGFRVESLYSGSKKVGRIKPDEYGVYHGLPMMILGSETQQRTYYDVPSVVNAITDPKSKFNIVLSQNKLYGEYGHPVFPSSMSDMDKLTRLCTVDEKNSSHLFTSVYTDSPASDGTIVLRADVKPAGPYGNVFKEGLDDPVVNTAFSLRAYVSTDMKPNGLKYRTVRQLTTFDTVGASGYAGTDKANAIGLESFSGDHYEEYEINVLKDGNLMIDQIALESFDDSDLNEIFGSSKVSRIIQSRTFVKVDQSLAERFPNMYRTSIFHDYLKEV